MASISGWSVGSEQRLVAGAAGRFLRGLTLLELLVTVGISAVLLATALPGIRTIIDSNFLTVQINRLTPALHLARNEAVKRNTTVSVCRSATGIGCGAVDVSWDDGWIVFVNPDNDDPATVDPGEAVLRVAPALRKGYLLKTTGNFANHVTFRSSGAASATGQFVLCNGTDVTRSRAVFVNSAGDIRAAEDTNDNGIPELPDVDPATDIASCTP